MTGAPGPTGRPGPCPRSGWTRSSPPATPTASGRTAWRPSPASLARRSATSCAATASRASPTRTDRRGSRSATSASARASCSTSTSRSSAGSPTAAVTASGPGRRDASRPAGYDFVHLAVDDVSRVAYVGIFPDERGTTCAGFLLDAAAFFAGHGVRIERVITDNAKNYTRSQAFAEALAEVRGPPHAGPDPSGPRPTASPSASTAPCSTNGPTSATYASQRGARRRLRSMGRPLQPPRPHTALNGMTPMEFLVNNVSVNHT